MNKTITNLHGDRERVSLPTPQWEGQVEIATGLELIKLWSGPGTGRKFAETYSYWQNRRTQCHTGQQYTELTESDYLHYCEQVRCEPSHVEATAV